jgi:hypothetical protein
MLTSHTYKHLSLGCRRHQEAQTSANHATLENYIVAEENRRRIKQKPRESQNKNGEKGLAKSSRLARQPIITR